MTWLSGLGALLGGLGAFLGAVSSRQARRHRRRLQALEDAHRAEHGPPHWTRPGA